MCNVPCAQRSARAARALFVSRRAGAPGARRRPRGRPAAASAPDACISWRRARWAAPAGRHRHSAPRLFGPRAAAAAAAAALRAELHGSCARRRPPAARPPPPALSAPHSRSHHHFCPTTHNRLLVLCGHVGLRKLLHVPDRHPHRQQLHVREGRGRMAPGAGAGGGTPSVRRRCASAAALACRRPPPAAPLPPPAHAAPRSRSPAPLPAAALSLASAPRGQYSSCAAVGRPPPRPHTAASTLPRRRPQVRGRVV